MCCRADLRRWRPSRSSTRRCLCKDSLHSVCQLLSNEVLGVDDGIRSKSSVPHISEVDSQRSGPNREICGGAAFEVHVTDDRTFKNRLPFLDTAFLLFHVADFGQALSVYNS